MPFLIDLAILSFCARCKNNISFNLMPHIYSLIFCKPSFENNRLFNPPSSSRSDDYDGELKRFQNYKDAAGGGGGGVGVRTFGRNRSPTPTTSTRTPVPAATFPRGSATFSDRESVLSEGSHHSPPPSKRYKPQTHAISPPREIISYGSEHHSTDLRDSLNRNKENRNRFRCANDHRD